MADCLVIGLAVFLFWLGLKTLDENIGQGVSCLVISVALLAWYVSNMVLLRNTKAKLERWRAELRAGLDIEADPYQNSAGASFADYVGGFPSDSGGVRCCQYLVTKNEYIFYCDPNKRFGVVPRDGILEIEILSEAAFTKKIELGALVVMGPLGLGAQSTERHDVYYLVVRFKDDNGKEYKIVFRSSDTDSFNAIEEYRLEYRERLAQSERKCPFCAEIIKAEALKCRFCGSELPPSSSDQVN